MTKLILVEISLFLLANGATLPENGKGMVSLGTFNKPSVQVQDGFVPTDYHVDFQSRNWDEAGQQCEQLFNNGRLAFIETKEEYDFLKRELAVNHGSGRFYFIGSTYVSKGWIWAGSKQELIADFILNAAELPDRPYNNRDTLIIDQNGEFDSKFVVRSKSDTNPFICEVARPSECDK